MTFGVNMYTILTTDNTFSSIQHIFFILLIATPACVLEEKTTSPSWLGSRNLADCCNGAGIISLVITTSGILLIREFWRGYCTKNTGKQTFHKCTEEALSARRRVKAGVQEICAGINTHVQFKLKRSKSKQELSEFGGKATKSQREIKESCF